MVYPATLDVVHGFHSGYFLDRRWNPDAPRSVPGRGLLTLMLPRSNHVLTAELRLGVSRAGDARAACRLPRDRGDNPVSHRLIDGVRFARRDTQDAGMSHFLMRHAYRGTANGRCYAIDLIVDGTDPAVYPGHPAPPMTRRTAFRRLTALLSGLRFGAHARAADSGYTARSASGETPHR